MKRHNERLDIEVDPEVEIMYQKLIQQFPILKDKIEQQKQAVIHEKERMREWYKQHRGKHKHTFEETIK